MSGILDKIWQARVIPVITLNKAEDALPLAKALRAGGLFSAEITFRTDAAEESIKLITAQYPDMLTGAGTVLTPEQADRAKSAGANFIVSPGLNPNVVRHCIEKEIPVIPGCMTPSDIEKAIELGLKTVKFFPAEAAGGLKMLKALSAPYPKVSFMPTGGITLDNLGSYLEFDKVIACGASFMAANELIAEKRFDEIARLSEQAVKIFRAVRPE